MAAVIAAGHPESGVPESFRLGYHQAMKPQSLYQ
jgi:hypothetical protein